MGRRGRCGRLRGVVSMKIAFDTEFNAEDNRTIDLISIGLVAEDGREYYAVSTEFNLANCGDWLQGNVLNKLPPFDGAERIGNDRLLVKNPNRKWKSRAEIRSDISSFFAASRNKDLKVPDLWAYFGSYDFVALCELMGGFLHMPTFMPNYTNDLRVEMSRNNVLKSDLPTEPKNVHDALIDARWTMESIKHLQSKGFVL